MALLTADFPHPNSTSLAQLVLEGMGQLRNELDARTKISQNEQENWLAEGKMGASNLLMMHNVFADQRDAAARDKQNEFNNSLGLAKLGIDQNEAAGQANYRNAEAEKIRWQMQQPDNPPNAPPGTILNPDGSSLLAPSAGAGGAPVVQPSPPAGMSAPNMVNGSSDQPLLGGGQVNPLLPPVSNALAPPAQNSPLIMSQDLAAGAVAGADSAMAGSMGGAAPGMLAQADGGQTPGLLMQTPGPAAPADQQKAMITRSTRTTDQPWIGKDGAIDLTKIPYNKQVQLGPGNIVSRQKVGEVDQLQYYKKVEQAQPNGTKKLITVPDGMPKLIMPDAVSKEPLAVMLPQDKVKAFETAKFFLDKQFPKMDAKDRQANMKQAGEMHATLLDLANDPSVQSHLRQVDNADFTAPPGFRVDGIHYDPKREMMVPTLKRDTPDELKAAASQRATLKAMWDDYKGMMTVAKDDNASETTKDRAKAKAAGLFSQILKTDPVFASKMGVPIAPGQPTAPGQPGASGTSQNPGFFYGQ